jgi:hypothetical protein
MDYGKIGGTSPNVGKKAIELSLPSPSRPASPQMKKAFKRDAMKRPVALWYQHNGTWYLNTVVDLDDMPSGPRTTLKGRRS